MRIIVSGGGSAGHIAPALAVCDALKQLDSSIELLYVGQADGMEARIVAASGLKFAAIKAGKFRRLHSAGTLGKLLNPATLGPNVRDLTHVVAGVAGSLKILRRFKPDVVFLKGGYVCLPVGLAARLLGIPYVIHESDVTPGLANRILSKWAVKIAVGFPVKSYKELDPTRLVYVGNPVRQEILGANRLEGVGFFKLNPDISTILVTGGSQGAAQINDIIIEALPELLPHYQVIHQTGDNELERVKYELKRKTERIPNMDNYHPYAFLNKMALALAAADIVVGRAGVGTINDSAVLGKPTILIPNYQMAGHQVENARVLARLGAVRVLDGAKLTAPRLVGEIERILGDKAEQERLSNAIRKFGRPEAAHDLAELVLAAGHGRAGDKPNKTPNRENEV